MTPKRKPDAQKIKKVLNDLRNAEWLGIARSWWPNFLFHTTDIQNAVSILKTGLLLSRQEAQARDLMVTDNASPDVILQTDDRWKDYVRFYFRPRTPTHFRSEGFRPRSQRSLNAHCPVPIGFIFDSFSILSRADSLFSYGNLARNPQVYSSVADLERMPFQFVYHVGRYDPGEHDAIVFHRNAEVIVPKRLELELNSIILVVCRSQAEYETLLHLLPTPMRRKWSRYIGVVPELDLFEKKWTFIERVEMSSSTIVFYFNPDTRTPGPFHASFKIVDAETLQIIDMWENPNLFTNKPLTLDLHSVGEPNDYYVRLWLDGQLAYADRYQEDLPW